MVDAALINKDMNLVYRVTKSSADVSGLAFQTIGVMQYTLKNILMVRYDSKLAKKLPPFVRKKAHLYKLSDEKIKDIYSKLVKLDINLRNFRGDPRDLLIDFFLKLGYV